MPGIIGGLAPAEAAGMLADDLAVAPDDDPLGVDAQLRGAPRRLGRDAVAIVVETHQAALRHRNLDLAEAVEWTAILDQAGPLGLEDLPDCLVALLRMRALARLGEAARLQPGIQLGVIAEVQSRREQVLARVADLVLDLALLPARRRGTGSRLDQIMRAHRQKAPVEGIPPVWAALPRTTGITDAAMFDWGVARESVHKFDYGHKQTATTSFVA